MLWSANSHDGDSDDLDGEDDDLEDEDDGLEQDDDDDSSDHNDSPPKKPRNLETDYAHLLAPKESTAPGRSV